jgi:galactokinase
MDQMASVACTEGHAILFDTRDETVEQVPLDVRAQGATLLVADTRVHHELADGAYADRTRACRRAAEALGVPSLRSASTDQVERLDDDELRRRARHVVTEIARVEAAVAALRAGDLATLGTAMSASHVSLRVDYEVSCVELDTAVDAALGAGALGARMTGGGFGGSAVVLAPGSSADGIADSVRAAASAAGHPEPRIYATVPSPGAHRDR